MRILRPDFATRLTRFVNDLHSQLAHLEDDELIENLARFADGTLSEAAVKARHHLSNEEWAAMGENDRLIGFYLGIDDCRSRDRAGRDRPPQDRGQRVDHVAVAANRTERQRSVTPQSRRGTPGPTQGRAGEGPGGISIVCRGGKLFV